GVARSCRRSISPSPFTTPARIFVPPTSTPIACVALMASGYRNPPNGRARREALSRLQRRAHEGKGAGADARAQDAEPREAGPDDVSQRRRRGRDPWRERQPGRAPPAAVDLEALDVGDAPCPRPPLRHLGGRGLLLRAERRRRREQAPAGRDERSP